MKAELHSEITAWLMQAGLAGESENATVDGFCERCVAAGLPIGRAHVFIDTLHPVHEGRLFRWGHNPNEMPLMEYGRTVPVPDSTAEDALAAERWRKSPFYRMLQTGESLLRRKVPLEGETEFAAIAEIRGFGMTDYVAIISRFAPEGVIGEMDGVYSSWATRVPDGFSDGQIAALQRLAPFLALAIKSVSLARRPPRASVKRPSFRTRWSASPDRAAPRSMSATPCCATRPCAPAPTAPQDW